ncbi:MAG: LytTR family DNA-binding domain-containing protein [Eubacteriales bacterium]
MFYVAICDDEQKDLAVIAGYLKELNRRTYRMEILPFNNGQNLVATYKKGQRFDLIILDMMMEPLNGIDTAKKIRVFDTQVPIIIVTATVEFAMDGYKINAYRYILKPVEKEHFLKEVRHILSELSREESLYYSFTNECGLNKIKLADIYYLESNLRTIRICAKNKNSFFTGTLCDIEEQLKNQNFVRIHKSFIVNLKYIRNIFREQLVLENGELLPLSRRKSHELREKFLGYIKGTV